MTLRDKLQAIIEAGDKATPRPWAANPPKNAGPDAQFIALSANSAQALARFAEEVAKVMDPTHGAVHDLHKLSGVSMALAQLAADLGANDE